MSEPLNLPALLAEVRRLKELAGKATPGERELSRYDHGGGRVFCAGDNGKLIADLYWEGDRELFITCSPEKIIALCEAVERLAAALPNIVFDAVDSGRGMGGSSFGCKATPELAAIYDTATRIRSIEILKRAGIVDAERA